MNIIDSSLWMEYFLGTDIDISIRNAVTDTDNLIVPVICIYEVYRKMQTESVSADVLAEVMQKGKVIDVNYSVAVLAAKLSKQYSLPMADSIIYATAKMNDAVVWTQDRHFENLDSVKYFPKWSK